MEFDAPEFTDLIKKLVDQPITKVEFCEFMTSSSQTVSSIFDLIGNTLDEETFTHLLFDMFVEFHSVETWTLS